MAHSTETQQLVELAGQGDHDALAQLFDHYRDRLRRMVELRMDHRLRRRLDASDVIQEAQMDAAMRVGEYARQPTVSFFVWLRFLTSQKLVDLHRHHLGVMKRNAAAEVPLYRGVPGASSLSVAEQLLGKLTTPTRAAVREELRCCIQRVLEDMEPMDREILVLRHFERMSNTEAAEALNIRKSAASKRFVAALKRLRKALNELPGFDASLAMT